MIIKEFTEEQKQEAFEAAKKVYFDACKRPGVTVNEVMDETLLALMTRINLLGLKNMLPTPRKDS